MRLLAALLCAFLLHGQSVIRRGPLAISSTATTARAFNGTNANLTGSAELSGASTFTIAFWMKSANLAQTNTYLLAFGTGSAVLYGYASSGGNAQVELYNCTADCRTSSQITIPDVNWHHVAYRYNGTTLDKFLDGSKTTVNGSLSAALQTSASSFVVAAAGGSNYFSGSIARVYLSTSALTDGQITTLAGSTCSSSGVSGTVGYWLLPGTASPEPESSPSPNSNSLTVNNATQDTSGPTCSGQ